MFLCDFDGFPVLLFVFYRTLFDQESHLAMSPLLLVSTNENGPRVN